MVVKLIQDFVVVSVRTIFNFFVQKRVVAPVLYSAAIAQNDSSLFSESRKLLSCKGNYVRLRIHMENLKKRTPKSVLTYGINGARNPSTRYNVKGLNVFFIS